MKLAICTFVSLALIGCAAPDQRTENAREDVVVAEKRLELARADAEKKVAEARSDAAEEIGEAAAELREARAELQKRLDEMDAELDALEAQAVTAEEKAEVADLRRRQTVIVTRVRDEDDRGFAEERAEMGRQLDELKHDLGLVRSRKETRPK